MSNVTLKVVREKSRRSSPLGLQMLVHLYTDQQVQLYLDALRKGQVTLYFDATGSLIKVPGQPKHIFYYVLMLANPLEGTAGMPVAEMLSNDQHSCKIHHVGSLLECCAKTLTQAFCYSTDNCHGLSMGHDPSRAYCFQF